jgi:hypothetical protein
MRISKAAIDSLIWLPLTEVPARVLADMEFRPTFSDEVIRMYQVRNGWVGCPRHFFPLKFASKIPHVLDKRTTGRPINMKVRSEPRPEQVGVFEVFYEKYAAGYTGYMLEARPGWGKTYAIIKMLEHINRSTIIIVPRKNLVKQWIDRFVEHSSLREKDIGVIDGGKGVWRNKKVVIGLIHSVVLDRWGSDFKEGFGVVVYDEVHASIPPATHSKSASMFYAKYRIGASATTKRRDGKHIIFEKHVEQCRLIGSSSGRLRTTVIRQEFEGFSGYVPPFMDARQRRGMLLSGLASNVQRNMLICEYVSMIHASGRRCVVISDRTEQLVILRHMCSTVHSIPFSETGFYADMIPHRGSDGLLKKRKVNKAALLWTEKNASVIFATYGKMSLGTDIADLAGMILATPQSDVTQTKGRIERKLPGKKSPVLIDIVDVAHSDATNWWRMRSGKYNAEGLDIVRRTHR